MTAAVLPWYDRSSVRVPCSSRARELCSGNLSKEISDWASKVGRRLQCRRSSHPIRLTCTRLLEAERPRQPKATLGGSRIWGEDHAETVDEIAVACRAAVAHGGPAALARAGEAASTEHVG